MQSAVNSFEQSLLNCCNKIPLYNFYLAVCTSLIVDDSFKEYLVIYEVLFVNTEFCFVFSCL